MLRRRSSATSCADAAAVMYCKSKMCPTSIRGWRFFKGGRRRLQWEILAIFKEGICILRNQGTQRRTHNTKLMYEDYDEQVMQQRMFAKKPLDPWYPNARTCSKANLFCIFRTKNRPLCASKVNRLADCSSSVDSSSMQMANASIGRRRRQQCILNFFGKKVVWWQRENV